MANNYYVDNDKLLQEIITYQNQRKAAVEAGLEEPIMSNYIGDCIMKIANKFAYRKNFINYSYREEMVSDGIEVCITGVRKFDHTRFGNPFAYLTQCCYYAFISRIKYEKKQQYIKSEIMKNFEIETFNLQEQDLDEEYKSSIVEFVQSNLNMDDSFLKKKKPAKVKPGPLDEFLEDVTVG